MTHFPAYFEEITRRVGVHPTIEFEPGPWAAPWALPGEAISVAEDAEVVELEGYALSVDEGGVWPQDATADWELSYWVNETKHSVSPADAIAEYRPWHLHGDGWGIGVHEGQL